MWIREARFLGEFSVKAYLLKKYALLAEKHDLDAKEIRKEVVKANKEFEKRKQEDLELYEKLAKKIDDEK